MSKLPQVYEPYSPRPPNLVLLKDFLPPYRIGATVRLKSGSPVLTVTAIQDLHVEVQWFEGQVAYQKIYPLAALRPVRNGNV